jgi:response regulator of citrate/malate metabolism
VKGSHPNSQKNLEAGRRTKGRTRYSYAKLARVTQRMMQGRYTVLMLARHAKISRNSAERWNKAMHDAGCVHIVEYIRSPKAKSPSRVYEWGHGNDVPRPEKKLRREWYRGYKAHLSTLDGAWKGLQA